jgi:hypothetical protein
VHCVLELEHAMRVIHPAIWYCDVECWPQRLPGISCKVVAASSGVVCEIWGWSRNCRDAAEAELGQLLA